MAGENYTISEVQLPLLGGVAGHDMLVLKDPDGTVIGEIDGLATSSSGSIKAIGYLPSDTLQVYAYNGPQYYYSTYPQTVLASGSEADITSMWNAGLAAGSAINDLDLPYPFMGLGANSNSVASTIIAAMGLPETTIPGSAPITPGVGTLLLPTATLQAIQSEYNISGTFNGVGDSSVTSINTVNGMTTVTVANPDGGQSISTYSIAANGDGLSDVKTYSENGDLAYEQTTDVSSTGTTTMTLTGSGAIINADGAQINLGTSTDATIYGSNNVVAEGTNNSTTLNGQNNLVSEANGASITLNSDSDDVITGDNGNLSISFNNGQIQVAGNSSSIASGDADVVDVSSRGATNINTYDNGVETADVAVNSSGKETSADFWSGISGNDYETNYTTYSTSTGAETSNAIYDPSTDNATSITYFAGNAQNNYETAFSAWNPTTGYETSYTAYNASGQTVSVVSYTGTKVNDDPETSDALYTSGVETSENFYNTSSGKLTSIDDYAGTTTDNYVTSVYDFNTATGMETSEQQFNASGEVTELQSYAGTAGLDPETGLITYNASTGAETSSEQFNSASQETSLSDYAGTSSNNYVTSVFDFNTATGMETSEQQFNASGEVTELQSYAGSAGFDPETGLITYNASTGAETSSGQFDGSGQETSLTDYAGTSSDNYITNVFDYSTATGMETSEQVFNSSGQVTEIQSYAGTSGLDPESSAVTYDPSNGIQTSNEQFNSSGQETNITYYADNPSDNYATETILFGAGNPYESETEYFNAEGINTEDNYYNFTTGNITQENTYNPSTGVIYQVFYWLPSEDTGSGSYANEVQTFFQNGEDNGGVQQDAYYDTSTGVMQSATLYEEGYSLPYEQELFNGGPYAYQIAGFDPSTGQQISTVNFNASTGAELSVTNDQTGETYSYSDGNPNTPNVEDGGDYDYYDDDYFGYLGGTPDYGDGYDDPLVLNLNGQSVQTSSLSGSSVQFDMQNNGQPVRTAWITSGEGFLVYDPSGNATSSSITQQDQLVSNFAALQSLASSVDGAASETLSASDPIWNDLKIWITDGATGQGAELMSLSQLGIASLNLNAEQVSVSNNGNTIVANSSFTFADGSTGNIAGVELAYQRSNSSATTTGAGGSSATDAQVQLAIQAMAAYRPAIAASTLASAYQATPETLLAANPH